MKPIRLCLLVAVLFSGLIAWSQTQYPATTTLESGDTIRVLKRAGDNYVTRDMDADDLGGAILDLDGFSILLVPDTQQMPTNIMAAMADEVIARINAGLDLRLIINGGDITQTNAANEYSAILNHFYTPVWAAATNAARVMTIGNHDVPAWVSRDTTLFNTYFGNAAITNGKPSDVTYLFQTNGYTENMVAIRTIAGEKWAFFGLEAFPRLAAVNWASNVVVSQSIKPGRVVVATHSHLRPNGVMSGGAANDGFADAPMANYAGMTDGMSGKQFWAMFGRRFRPLILSCHELGSGFGRASLAADDGRMAHSLLVNGQLGSTTGDAHGTGLLAFFNYSGGVLLPELWHPSATLDIPEAESPIDLDQPALIDAQAVGSFRVRNGTERNDSSIALENWTDGVLTDVYHVVKTNGSMVFRWGRTNAGSTAASNVELLTLHSDRRITQNGARLLPALSNAFSGVVASWTFDGPHWALEGASLAAPTNTLTLSRTVGARGTGVAPLGTGLVYPLAPNLTDNFTLTFWYRNNPIPPPTNNVAVFVQQFDQSNLGAWQLGFTSSNTVRWASVTSNVRSTVSSTIGTICDGHWRHFAASYSSGGGGLIVYTNGVAAWTNLFVTPLSNGGVYPLVVGGSQSFPTDHLLGGAIDSVLLHSRVLTPAEILDEATHR